MHSNHWHYGVDCGAGTLTCPAGQELKIQQVPEAHGRQKTHAHFGMVQYPTCAGYAPCPAGKWRIAAAVSPECTACKGARTTSGNAATWVGPEHCKFPTCPPGKYRFLTSPDITGVIHNEATIVDVPSQRSDSAAADVCKDCPKDTYNAGTSLEPNEMFQCTPCPFGWITSSTGATSESACVPAPCPRGKYRDNPQITLCTVCPSGQTTREPGQTSSTACFAPMMQFFVSSHRAFFAAKTPTEYEFDCVHVTIQLCVRHPLLFCFLLSFFFSFTLFNVGLIQLFLYFF